MGIRTLKVKELSVGFKEDLILLYAYAECEYTKGMTIDLTLNLKLKLTYDKKKQGFEMVEVEKNIKVNKRRAIWVKPLEALSIGIGRIATVIIEDIAKKIVEKNMLLLLNKDLSFDLGSMNIGGPLGGIVKNMKIVDIRMNPSGNFVFSFTIARPKRH